MAYTPIISQEENVVVVKCPTCRGSVMNFIERFAGNRDVEDMEHYRERGFNVSTITVRRLGVQEDCRCSALTAPQVKPAAPTQPKVAPTGKPLLRMPRKA